jgi:uncharacterized protein with ATP-grasp and redox domains
MIALRRERFGPAKDFTAIKQHFNRLLLNLLPHMLQQVAEADVLVSKGQGNYEGLSGCGLNIFYLFLCKCDAFIQRFNVPQFTGVMTREAF